jgi:hypothetical protein
LFARHQADSYEVGFPGDARESLGLALDAIARGIVLAGQQRAHHLKRARGSRHQRELLVEIDNLPNHEFMEGHDFDHLFGLLGRACEKNLLAASNGCGPFVQRNSTSKNPADGEPHAGFQTT